MPRPHIHIIHGLNTNRIAHVRTHFYGGNQDAYPLTSTPLTPAPPSPPPINHFAAFFSHKLYQGVERKHLWLDNPHPFTTYPEFGGTLLSLTHTDILARWDGPRFIKDIPCPENIIITCNSPNQPWEDLLPKSLIEHPNAHITDADFPTAPTGSRVSYFQADPEPQEIEDALTQEQPLSAMAQAVVDSLPETFSEPQDEPTEEEAHPYEMRVTQAMHCPTGATTFSEGAIRLTITDQAAGEYLELTTVTDEGTQTLTIEPREWPYLRATIDQLIDECRDNQPVAGTSGRPA